MRFCPVSKDFRGEFAAVIHPNLFRITVPFCQLVQIAYDAQRWHAGRNINAEYFAIKVINNIKCPKPDFVMRSEERRVGKECRCGWPPDSSGRISKNGWHRQ